MNGVLIRLPAGVLSRSLIQLKGGKTSCRSAQVDHFLVPSHWPKRQTLYLIAASAAALGLLALPLLAVDALARVTVASSTIWAPVGILHGANLCLALRRKKKYLSLPAQLDGLKSISMRDGLISAKIPMERLSLGDAPFYLMAFVTLALGCFQLHQAFIEGRLAGLSWGPGPPLTVTVAVLFAIAITAGVVVAIQSTFDARGRLQSHLAGKMRAVLDPLNLEVAAASAEWNRLDPEIASLAKALRIRPPVAQLPKILGSLDRRLAAVCADSRSICRELWDARECARIDRAELQAAWWVYESVETAAKAVEPALIGAPATFLQALARCQQRLSEPETRELLTHRNWAAYRLFARVVREQIECLPELGPRLRSGQQQPPPPFVEATQGRSDRERAYMVLRLPPGASALEIQRAYRWLSSVWHPDRLLAADDSEMKAINWAYEYLQKAGDA